MIKMKTQISSDIDRIVGFGSAC